MTFSTRLRLFNAATLAPWLIFFCVFWLYPLGFMVWLSFVKYGTINDTSAWVGLENFTSILTDPLSWRALQNTVVFTVGTVPVTLAIALFLALLLNSPSTRFKGFFRAIFFMPTVLSIVVVSLIFSNIYVQNGTLNSLFDVLKLPFPAMGWLQDPATALGSVMAMDIWISIGFYMVMILSGLQAIPNDLYESAKLNGASKWQEFRLITLPLLKPTILFCLVVNTIKSFLVTIEIIVMTQGGPLDTTTTLGYLIYKKAFSDTDKMGEAAGLACIVLLFLGVLSFVQLRVLRQK